MNIFKIYQVMHSYIIHLKLSFSDRIVFYTTLMADIISKKYVDATPFYRQEQNFKRRSIPVTRNNMCNWRIDVSKMYFAPLVSRMKEIMFADALKLIPEKDRNQNVICYPEIDQDHLHKLYLVSTIPCTSRSVISLLIRSYEM